MSSFSDDISAMLSIISQDPDLTALLATITSRPLTAKKVFKNRTEIPTKDYPLLMATRPTVKTAVQDDYSGVKTHQVRFFFGFYTDNRDAVQDWLVQFEELMEAAIMADTTLGGRVENVAPGECSNDQGKFHPVYFMVKDFYVSKEAIWAR